MNTDIRPSSDNPWNLSYIYGTLSLSELLENLMIYPYIRTEDFIPKMFS